MNPHDYDLKSLRHLVCKMPCEMGPVYTAHKPLIYDIYDICPCRTLLEVPIVSKPDYSRNHSEAGQRREEKRATDDKSSAHQLTKVVHTIEEGGSDSEMGRNGAIDSGDANEHRRAHSSQIAGCD